MPPSTATSSSETLASPAFQRVDGVVRLEAQRIDGRTRLRTLYQEGAGKLRCPRVRGETLEAVLINTAGGLTGGDRFRTSIALGEGASASLTTQACEKAYRSDAGEARVETRLTLGDRARLFWLPQETILFDRARLHRSLDVEMAADATLLAVESVIFGRTAMGERVRAGLFRDSWRVRRGGTLLHAEEVRLDGAIAETLARPAVAAGGVAVATILLVAADAPDRLDAARAATEGYEGVTAGASALDGRLVVRLVATDGLALRRALLPLLARLGGAGLPKVWTL